jgi:hypothetical protein
MIEARGILPHLAFLKRGESSCGCLSIDASLHLMRVAHEAFLKRGESSCGCLSINASLHLMRVAHEMLVLSGGALGTPWTFPEDFLFSGVLHEELSTMGTWR